MRPEILIIIFIGIIIITLIAKKYWKKEEILDQKNKKKVFEDITDRELQEYIPSMNVESLKDIIFQNYVNIKNALLEYDYEKLRNFCTDDIYNYYVAQAESYRNKSEKNITKNYKIDNIFITRIFVEDNIVKLMTYLNISLVDYVVDSNNNIISGSNVYSINDEHIEVFCYSEKANRFVLSEIKQIDNKEI